MVIYTREKKTLIIPEGLQCGSADCSEEMAIAYSSGITAGYRQGYDVGYEKGQQDCPECSGGTDCSSAITEAYQSGYTAGVDNQRGRLVATAITSNGLYERTDGFCCIDVQVPTSGDCSEAISEAYQSGITKGIADQKALLGSVTITYNHTTTNPNGWSSVTVDVPKEVVLGTLIANPLESELSSDRYWIREFGSGSSVDGWGKVQLDMKNMMNYGKAQQKALLGSTAITENGTYTTNGDGWSSVTVNVASSGDCSQAIEEAYQSGCTYAFDAAAERGFTFSTSGVITVSEDIVISRDDYDFLLDTGTNDFKFIDRVQMSFPSQSGFTYLLKAGNHTYDVKNVITFSPERTGTPPAIYVAPRPSAPYHNITVQSFGNGVVTPQSQEFYLEVYGSH